MRNLLKKLVEIFDFVGQVRTAGYLTRMGRWKEAREVMLPTQKDQK